MNPEFLSQSRKFSDSPGFRDWLPTPAESLSVGDAKSYQVAAEMAKKHAICQEWIQMKENMRNGIIQLEESRETLVSLEFKMGSFSDWIRETSEKIGGNGMKIDILKNGKNNSAEVIANLTELNKNCEDKKPEQEFLSNQVKCEP